VSSEDFMLFVSLAWAAWAFRNSVVFEEPWQNRDIGVLGFVKLVGDYAKYVGAVSVATRRIATVSRNSWCPPAAGAGKLLAFKVCRLPCMTDVSLAEALVARMGVLLAKEHGHLMVELECDALTVVKAVNGSQRGRAPIDLIFDDIDFLRGSFSSFSCMHIKRSGNCVAHLAARISPSNGVEQTFVSSFPQGLIALADIDFG
uniref:RNase H type-1 domain-containing protein n=1 Tax=Chenopodium quinoa TaxID=63459 RepID=A0A803KX59_CHEQI